MTVLVDRIASARYRDELEDYLRCVVSGDGQFCCSSADRWCQPSIPAGRALATGQLSYVGDGYSAEDSGKALRILVVSMQVGDDEAPVSMARRREQVRGRIPQLPKDRNPHMRSVTYALQLLFDRGLEPTEERLENGIHVLDAYAMANSTLCSNLIANGDSRKGAPTSTMLRRCRDHLRRTVEILRPTIIHTQGRTKAGPSTHSAFESIVDHRADVSHWNSRVRIGDVEAIWCSLPHPSSGPPQAWQWRTNKFFQEVAAPSLLEARRLALGLS